MTVSDLPIEIAKLELKRGDIVIVSVPNSATVEQRKACGAAIKPVLPEGVRGLVLSEGVSVTKIPE